MFSYTEFGQQLLFRRKTVTGLKLPLKDCLTNLTNNVQCNFILFNTTKHLNFSFLLGTKRRCGGDVN